MTIDNQLRVEEVERRRLLDDVHYDVTLSLGDAETSSTFISRSAIDFRCADDGGETFLNLLAPHVRSVMLNGRTLDPDDHEFDGRRLRLRRLRAGDNHVEVIADCAYEHTGVGLHRFRDPVDDALYLYTHFEPFDAHRAIACFDQPDIKATLTMHLETPEGWTVCGNAPGTSSVTAAGITRWDFDTTPPLPPYLFAVAAGAYDVLDGPAHGPTALRLMCRRSLTGHLREQADELFSLTTRGLEYFERRYGHDHPFATYTQVFVPESNVGAMENPGCVTFNEMFIFRGPVSEMQRMRRANVVLHEMVHVMGFGDVVTMCDWGDLWLNETFATVEATIAAAALGIAGAWVDFAGLVKSRALHQDQLSTTHPVLVDAPDTDSIRANFDGITYHKGASVLRQLIAWVGDAPYAAGIRSYFAEFFWSNATRTDFLDHQSRRSGKELDEWARLWLENSGVNAIIPEVEVEDGRYTSVNIHQLPDTSSWILRPHRIQVALFDREANGHAIRRRISIPVDLTDSSVEVADLAGEPVATLVVANDDDLTFAKLRFDERSLATLLGGGVSAIDDPLTRSLCWTALHDMTRDGELPSGDLVAAVTAQAPQETDPILLERLLVMAVSAAERFSADERRGGQLAALAITAAAQLAAARSPLLWVRCLAATARTDAHLTLLQRILEGTVTVPGLDVDVELHWTILARLATEGRAGASAVDAALEVDPTDAGHRRALACLSARPLEEAKAQAWTAAVEDTSLSRARVAATLGGFGGGLFTAGGFLAGGRDQEELTEPYVAKYVEVIPVVWQERDYELARVITEGLFPYEPATPETVAAVEQLIETPDLPWNGRRILMEGRDALVRAQRAREADRAG